MYGKLTFSYQIILLTTRCHCFLFLSFQLALSTVLLSSTMLSKGKTIRSHQHEYFVYLFILTICSLNTRFEKHRYFVVFSVYLLQILLSFQTVKCFTTQHFTFEFSFSRELWLTLGPLNKKNVFVVRLIQIFCLI